MKKISVLIMSMLIFLTTSCSQSGDVSISEEFHSDIITIDIEASTFDVNNETIYIAECYDSGKVQIYEDDEGNIELPIYETVISEYNFDGELINEYVFDEKTAPQNLIYAENGMFYYTIPELSGETTQQTLMKYTIGEVKAERIYTFQECITIKKMELIGNSLYIVGVYPKHNNVNYDDGYYDSGECLVSYDLNTSVEKTIVKNGIIDFSKANNEELLMYAHNESGFYFVSYNALKEEYGSEIYKNLGMLLSFCAVDNEKYIFSSNEALSGTSIGSTKEDGLVSIFDADTFIYGTSEVYDEKYIFMNSNGINIIDISIPLKSRLDTNIKMVSAEYIYEAPSAAGYPVKQETVDYDSYALTVLSQDSNYDLYLLNSRQSFSANIRDKGSFYPLNDVDGVQEYIDNCFPFIKKAAINQYGEIWMLPVDIKVNVLAYNDEICKNAGVDLSEKMTVYEFVDTARNLYSHNIPFYIGAEYYSELLLSNYLINFGHFNTEEFRKLAVEIKNEIYGCYEAFTINSCIEEAMMSGDYSEIAFRIVSTDRDIESFTTSSTSALCTFVPMCAKDSEAIVTCTFVCVNPNSANLEQTLNYVSRLAKNMTVAENNMLVDSKFFTKSQFHGELYDIYKNATVRFTYSDEIYASDFENYLSNKITLDEFITEADRKLSAYMNE